jgi:GT2 family glycosyltransferase
LRTLACVISWNSADQLAGALDSLVAQDHPDLAVAVIDNASTDHSREVARRYGDVRVVANPRNLGFAGAANQGVTLARAAGADALCICNPDAVLATDYLRAAAAALDADPARAAVQGKLWRTGAGPPRIDTTGHLAFRTRLFRNRGENEPDEGQYDEPGPVFGVSGAVGVYRVAALDDVAVRGEVFDNDLFAFFEDVDLDWRLQLRGWQVWYTPAARAWHERGGAGPRRSALVERLNFSNRFLVITKNDDVGTLLRDLPGVGVTSVLKAAELGLTVPSALARSLPRAGLLPAMVRKRRVIQASARVDPAAVVARWFGAFDYAAWVRTWWGRIRA